MARKGEIVGAVDFGSREVRVVIARQGNEGPIQVIGHGEAPSRGCVSQGVIQDLGAAQLALKKALTTAEREAGFKVQKLFVGITGKGVKTTIRDGKVKLEKHVVEHRHLQEALQMAESGIVAPGTNPVHSITSQEWYIDDMRVSEPLGIRGTVLKVRVHIALIPTVIEDNIVSCIDTLGRELEDLMFLPLATGLGCLTLEDMDLGVAVMDIGHNTTSVVVYRDRRVLDTRTFDWGGFLLTGDVAGLLHVSYEEALDLILEYGVPQHRIDAYLADEEDAGKSQGAAGETEERAKHIKLKSTVRDAPSIVNRDELETIVFDRSEELMTTVRQHLHAGGQARNLVRGIVLTGGTALIPREKELAAALFEVPANIGLPDGFDALPPAVNRPEYVGVLGVVRHGFEYRAAVRSGRIEPRRNIISNTLRKVGGFIGRYFI